RTLPNAVRGVGRQPTPWLQINLRPVVHIQFTRFGLPPGLPPRRHAGRTAQRDKARPLYAAIPTSRGQPFYGEARNDAVLHFRAPRYILGHPAEYFSGLFQR